MPNKNSESGEMSRVLRFTAMMTPAWVVPPGLPARQEPRIFGESSRFVSSQNLVCAAAAEAKPPVFSMPSRFSVRTGDPLALPLIRQLQVGQFYFGNAG